MTVPFSGSTNGCLTGTNADFSQSATVGATANILDTNGEFWIGSTALNAGGTHINVGTITSTSLTVGYTSPNITIEALGTFPYVYPVVYPYFALSTDYYIAVDTSSARTIELPNAPSGKKVYIIKDRVGSAAAFNITITTPGGIVLIDGATSYTIAANYGAVQLLFNGSSYEVF